MTHHGIDPLKKVTLATMVAERLRELVVQGTYKPGEQLNEVELASRFGVSRGPVREGLRQLVHDGILRSEPHRGAFVPILTEEDIADIYYAREAIESAAVKMVIGNGQYAAVGAALSKLAQSMQRAFAGREWTRFLDLDMRFHLELVRGADSSRLTRMYSSLVDEARICLRTSITEPQEHLVAEHIELARLLESGDLDATLNALTLHLRNASEPLSGTSVALGGAS
jgi:DNA-binding GntR family transcriptional regulator